MASYLQLVKQFTEESSGKKLPTKPTKMSKDEVRFLTRMVISELLELVSTVCEPNEEPLDWLKGCLNSLDIPKPFDASTKTDEEIMAEQYDAFGDWIIYTCDMAGKKGVDLDRFIQLAHEANMAKRFPDGTFHRRPEDGKVIKPQGWVEPDMVKEIKRQLEKKDD